MTKLSEKRFSIEPVSALLGHNTNPRPIDRRPRTTTLGAVLVLFRSITGFLWIATIALLWKEIAPQLTIEGVSSGEALAITAGLSSIGSLVLLVLAVLIWRGSNRARILVMSGLTLSIITAAVGYFTLGERITLSTSLLVVAFDVLVLLALSNRDTRDWSRLTRAERAAIQQQRKLERKTATTVQGS